MARISPSSPNLRVPTAQHSKRWLAKTLFAIACFVLALFMLPVLLTPAVHRTPARTRAAELGNELVDAARRYHKTFGRWPRGTHVEMLRELRGDNPKQIIFLQVPEASFSPAGELLDPWAKPYRFSIDMRAGRPIVQSAGPDGEFANLTDRSDDYVSTQHGAGPSGIPGLPF